MPANVKRAIQREIYLNRIETGEEIDDEEEEDEAIGESVDI
jgi:hypothetical protein